MCDLTLNKSILSRQLSRDESEEGEEEVEGKGSA